MKFSKKLAIAAVPAVMALSSTNVDSKILLMSQEGWEVSFDGAANAFATYQSGSSITADGVAATDATKGANGVTTFQNAGTISANGTDSFGVITGLLPNVWGMTLKAPTVNGLDVQARLGLYTHMQGTENALGSGFMNIRETNASVSGSFGTVLVGKSIGIHQTQAILNDMTLFGIGAIAGSASDQSGTSLGRIGVGYLYTDFRPQISWTLPSMGGFGAKIGIIDPSDLAGANVDATINNSPRVDAEITYNGEYSGLGINLWVDGSYQNTDFNATNAVTADNGGPAAGTDMDDVDSAGVGFGTKLSYDMFSLVATGFYGSGMGMRAMHGDYGAIDRVGKPRNSYGGYIQGTADFGQGTSVGYSYGGNFQVQTGHDIETTAIAEVNGQTGHMGMIWHNVTDNFRLVAEGGYTEQSFHMGSAMEDTYGGVGAFFFW